MQTTVPNMRMENVPMDDIAPSTLNPRKTFDQAALEELAASIRALGLIEPIVVRDRRPSENMLDELADDPPFEIVAGERRWRACKLAGLTEVPVLFRGRINDAEALKIALLENLQRQNLDPIEEAEGYRQLNRIVGLKQAQIADAVNRSQPAIANAMRLLELPDDVRDLIRTGQLSASHGIALARWKDFPEIVRRIAEDTMKNSLTAKEVEKFSLYRNDFEHLGLVRFFDRSATFDTAICERCPFGAYRVERNDWWDKRVCLNPDHFDELQGVADAERENELKRKLEAAGGDEATIPQLSKLGYETYEMIGWGCPTDCTENCECRGRGINHNDQIVSICTNPKRFRSLKAKQTRRENAERRDRAGESLKKLEEYLQGHPVGIRGLAILVTAALTEVAKESLDAAANSLGVPAPDKVGYSGSPDRAVAAKSIAALDRFTLFRLGVEALLRDEIRKAGDSSYASTPWLDYFMGEEEEAGE